MTMRRRSLLAMSLTLPVAARAVSDTPLPLPQVVTGRIERLAIDSGSLPPRPVDVWLPADYDPARRYQVLYAHDGQMLFDASTTWNRQAWQLHEAVAGAVRAGRMADTIIVGVWNGGPRRYAEYYPRKMLDRLPDALRAEYLARAMDGRSDADAYLRFLVETLKPEIDHRYSTHRDAARTAVMGSSMGGLISLYALAEHPQVFGAAAALSTHWVGLPTAWGPDRLRNAAAPLAAFGYLQAALPAPGRHRVYMDRGTTDLEAFYAPHQAFVDELMHDLGWRAPNFVSRVVEGTGHNERDWAARAGEVVAFLLGPR
ncbi:esterase [Rubrivivax albus]|uniref:Esterase n=2 Tax=Rubrivivax albus TaxID=2499835 RepID=A0A437JT02_9BURK|nr:esterase [Rubrivivax albus]